ncbi:lipid-A-disaccharide synthase [Kovacikia minuta CCNUW1]|uniref:lipid-A-disaccharide synthase n=1 Tax=Kovacikia minuta TaxID=2931930 RepID=UPI001CC956F2|nr:lipid-A-disaccharide synthase [Kovacikia minuta]UBF25719.1 lipid-A-disaccharide synthase [Kovacikia minuta CCNUW1]
METLPDESFKKAVERVNCSIDILILSNGPGELATWVKPVVQTLRQQLGDDREQVRISVVLSPCANASGQEATIARRFPEVDRVQEASHFFPFLLWGKTAENWDWRSQGVVLFLGGDQFFPVIVAKRLGYRSVIYAEWEARWHRWIDRFGVMRPEIATRAGSKYADKFTVVGDLMAEVGRWGAGEERRKGGKGEREKEKAEGRGQRAEGEASGARSQESEEDAEMRRRGDAEDSLIQNADSPQPSALSPQSSVLNSIQNLKLKTHNFSSTPHTPHPTPHTLIGILPGSKPMKLSLGVPLLLAIAEQIQRIRPDTRFVIPVAPSLDLLTLAQFGDPEQNPVIRRLGWTTAELVTPEATEPFLKTGNGLRADLWTQSPAYELLAQCTLCLTTVGANTAELGALAVPMIVILPTQQMDVMRAWDGLPGLLANLPGVGSAFATAINWLALRRMGLLAWPNIWAKEEIVPELVGELHPEAVAQLAIDLLNHPEKLEAMRTRLRNVRGKPGAAEKLVQLVREEIEKMKAKS